MKHALDTFRGKSFCLREPTTNAIPGLLATLEPEVDWFHTPPDFVTNLSGKLIGDWIVQRQRRPATYLCKDDNVILFAQNSTLDKNGVWACESQLFRTQFLRSYLQPAYQANHPGPKPNLTEIDKSWSLSLENLINQDVEVIDEPVFLATPLEPDNWGRWIATVVTKTNLFHGFGSSRKFLCRVGPVWQRALLNDLGISNDRIMVHEPGRTYFCRDLMTVRYSATSMVNSNLSKSIYSQISAERRLRYPDIKIDRIFISRLARSQQKKSYRVLQNESELIQRLLERDFRIIEPENYSFSEQVAMFAAAKTVVALGGAGLYNVVFSNPGTRVVTLEASDTFIRPHSRLIASMGHKYGVIFGREDATDRAVAHKRWSVNVDEVTRILDCFI